MMRHTDQVIYGDSPRPLTRREVLEEYIDYAEAQQTRYGSIKCTTDGLYGFPTSVMLRPILGLFAGEAGEKFDALSEAPVA